ncbi:hypothetical protein [Pelagicoccus sp. SDUM812005]|uniref:hypothetical protein n=1 Tax=Pelagicoccus sp. SDUM812005 TaxID=3041257 RepID=UPI00280D8167|nr:hypothetical protein [Pelagicoccus sp. SDUM812005]MDQ8183457.1 hypothetical protein [Pelagicoccus sp. SDUM812005]
MKISLDDVTVPLDVITPEMMEDFNITEQEELFDIVSNMESRDDSFLSGVYESGASYKIRGFVGVKSLRNFAASNMTFDSYNSTRFIASKGPNAILFGSGPGGGSVSFFTKRYNLGSKDSTNISVSADSFGSMRYQVTGSKTLIEDTLGIFYGAFDDTKKYYERPSYQARNGIYLSATYRPLENTVITGSYESRAEDVFRPASHYGTLIDYYSRWDELGSPVTREVDDNNRNTTLYFPNGTVLSDGTVVEPGGSLSGQPLRNWGMEMYSNLATINDVRNQPNYRFTLADGQVMDMRGSAWTDRTRDTALTDGQRNFLVDAWPKDLNPTGLNGGAEVDTEAIDLNIEQKLRDDLYLMLAYGKTENKRVQYQHRHRQLYRDPNYYLQDGVTLNPHVGEFYVENTNYNFLDRTNESETYTATLAYELDLEERNKYLGKHNFAVMHSNEVVSNINVRQSMLMTETPDGSLPLTDVDLGTHRLYTRTYLGHDLSALTADDMPEDLRYIHRTGVFSADGYTWELFDGVGSTGASSIDTTSNMFVAQSNFFRSRLITSFGYRAEEVEQYVVNFGQNPAMQDRYTMFEHYTKEDAETEGFTPVLTDDIVPTSFPSTPWDVVDGVSRNVGAVFKLTPDIALVANAASNISGSPNRTGVFGQVMPNSEGESEDYGLRFNLFENKLRVEYTRYNTATTNQALQSSRMGIKDGDAENILKMMIQSGMPVTNVFEFGEGWDLRDFRSRGHEVTLSGSPVDGLSLRLAVSYNEQVATNIASVWMGWINENLDSLAAFVAANPNALNNESESTTTAAEHFQNILDGLATREGQEGIPNFNAPLWTAKGLAKYRFRDGALRGHETGVNIAWRGKQKSNFFRNTDGSYDYDRPFYTDDTTNVNFFWNYSKKIKIAERDVKWKVQLNVNNLFNSQNYTDRNFFYAIRGDETSELLSNAVNIKEPRRISLTNTFSF